METVEGLMKDLDESPARNGSEMYKVVVNGVKYSDFGPVPDDVRMAWDKGKPVKISWEFDKSGKYRNIKGIKGIDHVESVDVVKPDVVKSVGVKSDKFESTHGLLDKCLDSVGALIGKAPTSDGEYALVEAMFKFLLWHDKK